MRQMLLLLCALRATALVVSTRSWAEAGRLLKRRDVAAVVVEDALSQEARTAWTGALVGDVRGPPDVSAALFPDGKPPAIVSESARALCGAVSEFVFDSAPVRFRASVAETPADMAHCPRIHTDNLYVRCLLAAVGPSTVVVPNRPLFAFFGEKEEAERPDEDFFQPHAGDALLLKGRLTSNAARHRSPRTSLLLRGDDNKDDCDCCPSYHSKRVLLSVDRLADVS